MIDILYLAYNRLEFTRVTYEHLLANTDWKHVRRLVVYDDGSEDGTREYLDGALHASPVDAVLRHGGYGSPVKVMADYIGNDPAPVFAKIDNDIAVPPGWLPPMLDVLDRRPFLELLGMEAGMTRVAGRDGVPFDGVYDHARCTNIGGVGLMRASAFAIRPAMRADGRFGFTEWQHTYKPVRAWISPDLPVVCLDRLPMEPWVSLSDGYVERGWQRPHGLYDPVWMGWCWEWMLGVPA